MEGRLEVPRRPVIGIATQTQEAVYGQTPRAWTLGQKYIQVLVSCGAVPWLIPLIPGDEDSLRAIFDRLDGVFMAGGVDIDPHQYGETDPSLCGTIDPDRDWTEMALIRWAIAGHKPLLGVCRGLQALNVAAGGSLYQDIKSQWPEAIKHDYFSVSGNYPRDLLSHEVHVRKESRLAGILGKESVAVNSLHHQGIRRLAPGLVPAAHAPDGLIEAVEGEDGRFLVGVQWHPEELTEKDPAHRRLFTAFIEAAGASQSPDGSTLPVTSPKPTR
jgi:putative glutamine amidotransferase